jgi:hypothetical protein
MANGLNHALTTSMAILWMTDQKTLEKPPLWKTLGITKAENAKLICLWVFVLTALADSLHELLTKANKFI